LSAVIEVRQAVQVSANQSAPDDLVIVGYVSGAFGLQGWVKIRPYSTTADALLDAPSFWLESSAQAAGASSLSEYKRLSSKVHGEDVVARLDEVPDRTAAEALKGCVVKVSRQAFPALEQDEFYWVDLIGLSVQNLQGENLGVVRAMMDNGAQSILRVAGSDVPSLKRLIAKRRRSSLTGASIIKAKFVGIDRCSSIGA
jgi:16S rRNA processing protein RimM